MASAPDMPPPVMGRVDAIGRLVEADPMLADLQTDAGSAIGAKLALPQLAAVAPKLADSTTEEAFNENTAAVIDLLEQIRKQSADLAPSEEFGTALSRLQDEVRRDLNFLILLTREKLELQRRFASLRLTLALASCNGNVGGRSLSDRVLTKVDGQPCASSVVGTQPCAPWRWRTRE